MKLGLIVFVLLYRLGYNVVQGSTYTAHPGKRKTGPWTVLEKMPTGLTCVAHCHQQPSCFVVNYNEDAKLCEIVTEPMLTENDVTLDPDWKVYHTPANIADVDYKSFASPSQNSYDPNHTAVPPTNALDGNTNPYWGGGSCVHTDALPETWWMMDLGNVYLINGLIVVNRVDCCGYRFSDIQILIAEFDIATPTLCTTFPGPPTGNPITLTCSERTKGRYVKILRQNGVNAVMNFCEVDLF